MQTTLKFIKNRYFICLIALVAHLLIFEETTIFKLGEEYGQLKNVRKENLQRIKIIEDTKRSIQELKQNKVSLEKFARETYFMKKKDEVIFYVDEEKLGNTKH